MATINNLIDLEYTNNPFDLYDKTIWDIKNNEKKQLIEHIDNIISTKFEKKITEQNNIIKELIEENKKMNETLNNISTKFEKKITEQNKIIKQITEENKIIKQNTQQNQIITENKKMNDTINNLLFDLARHNVFNPAQCYGLEKYHSNILSANQLIEIEYIDYDFVSAELDKFYSTITNYRTSNHVDKDISNKKNFVKKMYLNPNEVSNINFKDKIFRVSAPHFIPYYFQNFIKEMNVRREYFQHDSGNGFKLFIWISDNNDEKSIIDRYPNIKFNFIPNINFQKHSVV
jgi:hypothetical protein